MKAGDLFEDRASNIKAWPPVGPPTGSDVIHAKQPFVEALFGKVTAGVVTMPVHCVGDSVFLVIPHH